MYCRPMNSPMNRTTATVVKAAPASAKRMMTPDQWPFASFCVAANTTIPCANPTQNTKLVWYAHHVRSGCRPITPSTRTMPPRIAAIVPKSAKRATGAWRAFWTRSERPTVATLTDYLER